MRESCEQGERGQEGIGVFLFLLSSRGPAPALRLRPQPRRARIGAILGGGLLLFASQNLLHQAGEVEAQNALAIAAAPQDILRIEIVEVDAAAVADDLQPSAAPLNQLDIFKPHREFHTIPSVDCCPQVAQGPQSSG